MRKVGLDVAGLLGNSISSYGITHALRMPLATPKSRPSLESSYRLLLSDPAASHIHPAAFAPPDMQYLNLGSLRLSSAFAKRRAIELLKNLREDVTLYQNTSTKGQLVEPLHVSVAGLFLTQNGNLIKCARLYAPVIDHTNRLGSFIQIVQEKFLSANVMAVTKYQPEPKPLFHTSVINNKTLRSKNCNNAPHIQRKLSGTGLTATRLASWDVRDLYAKYRDNTWAADFPLQRLCITEVRSMDICKDGEIIGRGCPELASVPLPGIKHLEQDAALEDVTYKEYERICV